MLADWETALVDELKAPVASSLAMGPFGSNIKTDNFVPHGVPVIRGGNLVGDRFKDEDYVYVTEEKADELRSANAFPGDLVFTHRGTLGQVGIIPKTARYKRYVVSQSQMKLTCDTSKVDPLFVFYFFRSRLGQYALLANTSTTGVPAISRPLSSLKEIKIACPPLPEQKAIASILGALDDKIELNRKMNETLEAMARAVFKSWFVDFDPIPGLGPHKEWQDSPLGRILKGWRIGTLGELCEIVMGQSPPGETYNESGEGLPFYQGIRDFGFRFPAKRVYCTTPTRIAQAGDVLLSVRAPVGSLNIASEECAVGRGVAALRIKGQHYGFLYYLMKETQVGWEKHEAEGTVFGSATKTDVQNFSVIVPTAEVISRFNEVVFSMDEAIKSNEMQPLTLSSIRDALLPKLLSGEIRVKDTERFLQEVV